MHAVIDVKPDQVPIAAPLLWWKIHADERQATWQPQLHG